MEPFEIILKRVNDFYECLKMRGGDVRSGRHLEVKSILVFNQNGGAHRIFKHF